ncbi:MAG: transporter substrate-binding domain-containing protein [Oscillospiraceae bacterium]
MKKQQWKATITQPVRKGISLLLVLLFGVGLLPVADAVETDKNRTLIRVGYPLQPGLSDLDEHGKYIGYTYDYLQEIAQYTGWEYEFVQLSGSQNEILTKMYDMLEKGELDLMGSTNYSKELDEKFDYPAGSYGSSFSTLEVSEDNSSISEANFQTMKNLRIAVLKRAKSSIAALESFCQSINITPTLIYCANGQELLDALNDDRADVLLSNDLTTTPGNRVVARFNPRPFYFATTNGNFDIINKLNSSMLMLNDSDPVFAATLYNKYFAAKANKLYFTDEEKAFLSSAPVLRVGVENGRMPLENVDDSGSFQGISVDIFKLICADTGLKYEFKNYPSTDDLMQALQKGELDMALGITYDYAASQKFNFSLTRPYLSAQIIMAARSGVDPYQLNGKRLALARGSAYDADFIGEVIEYDSILQCLDAVNRGEADYCYGNGYSVEYYCNTQRFRNLTLIPQSSQINKYCIGVARPANPLLLTSLNKTVRSIPKGDLQSIIYQNSTPPAETISLKDLIEANPLESVFIITLLTISILALVFCFAWFQMRGRRRVQLENRRFKLLSELSGEYFFEYSFPDDRLILTEKTVQTFGGNRVEEHLYSRLIKAQNEFTSWICELHDSIANEKSAVRDIQVPMADGSKLWLRISLAAVYDKNGQVNYAIGKVASIQEDMLEKNELSVKAQTDGLTGIYNMRTARSLIEIALQSPEPQGVLLVMDIDHFKSINDRFGHYTGDIVLRGVSQLLQSVFRDDDIIGRLGGDEFIVFMKIKGDKTTINLKFQQLQAKMKEYSAAWPTEVTLSLGAAIVKEPTNYEELYKSADNALYTAKKAGRNKHRISGEL